MSGHLCHWSYFVDWTSCLVCDGNAINTYGLNEVQVVRNYLMGSN